MRIAWLSHRAELGGAELSLAEGVRALAGRGHDVQVILPQEGPLLSRLDGAVAVHVCHHNPWVSSQTGWRLASRWFTYDLGIAVPRIARILRRMRADAVISNTITPIAGALAASTMGIPHAWFLREFGAGYRRGLPPNIAAEVQREGDALHFLLGRAATFGIMKRVSGVYLVNSETLKEYLAQWLPAQRLLVVYSAVEVPSVTERTNGRNDPDIRFRAVAVGRRKPSKGQIDAVLAIQLLTGKGFEVHLDLIGDSDTTYDEELRRLVATNGLERRVRFLPHTGPDSFVRTADAALICSRSEAFGRVTVEAMKLGTPVIGTAAAANLELIEDGVTGLLYRTGDARELAACIERLMVDDKLASRLVSEAQRRANERFNLSTYGTTLEDALFKIVRPRGLDVGTNRSGASRC